MFCCDHLGGSWVNQVFAIEEKGCQDSMWREWNSEAIKVLDCCKTYDVAYLMKQYVTERLFFFFEN